MKMLRKIKGYEILLLLIIPMWMGLANHWYSWYGKEDNLSGNNLGKELKGVVEG